MKIETKETVTKEFIAKMTADEAISLFHYLNDSFKIANNQDPRYNVAFAFCEYLENELDNSDYI